MAPVPSADVPVEEAHAREVIGVAVYRPEKDVLAFPLLGDEVRIGKQIIENVCVQCGLVYQRCAELVTSDDSILLVVGKMQDDSGSVPDNLTALSVFLHLPARGDVRIRVAVDDMALSHNFRIARQKVLDPFHAAELVHDCLDLAEAQFAVLHDCLLFS